MSEGKDSDTHNEGKRNTHVPSIHLEMVGPSVCEEDSHILSNFSPLI